jgi:bifunctional UDP-N-acetylglucosamine pyrophosphorylase/glucosamine-1-phosphate N-acetyltransferase
MRCRCSAGRQRQCQGRVLSDRHRRDRAQPQSARRREEVAFESVLGINNRAELAEAEAIWQRRRRREMMLAGVSLSRRKPSSSPMTRDRQDTVVEPNVFFGPGVEIAGAVIHAFSHLEGATGRDRAHRSARMRGCGRARISEKAKVGNFCARRCAEAARIPRL